METITLNNGVEMPVRGSGVDRADVFLETKIWISDYGYTETLQGFAKSAGKLDVEQIDLLILHQAPPTASPPKRGRRSAASPSIGTVAAAAPSTTPSSGASPPAMTSPPLR